MTPLELVAWGMEYLAPGTLSLLVVWLACVALRRLVEGIQQRIPPPVPPVVRALMEHLDRIDAERLRDGRDPDMVEWDRAFRAETGKRVDGADVACWSHRTDMGREQSAREHREYCQQGRQPPGRTASNEPEEGEAC